MSCYNNFSWAKTLGAWCIEKKVHFTFYWGNLI